MLTGLVLGLAIYNRVLLDFPLPLPLYKKLLGQSVGLRDLEEMQPRLGRSLRQLLQYDGPASVEVGFCFWQEGCVSFGQVGRRLGCNGTSRTGGKRRVGLGAAPVVGGRRHCA